MTQLRYSPVLHRTAQLTAAATLLLIFMGGLVTSYGAGLSVPDWPNSYGYNMFTFPPSQWVGGIFYEHTHRLMGTIVGILAIALTIIAWRVEPRRWVRWLCAGVLGAVIFQGILGGLRVVMVKLDLAILHACVAQAFLCLAALVAVTTSKWWIDAPECCGADDEGRGTSSAVSAPIPSPGTPGEGQGEGSFSMPSNSGTHGRTLTPALSRSTGRGRIGHRLIAFALVCVVAIYAQLVIGALMRHYQAGLAIPDFPLNYDKLLPPTNQASLDAVNLQRVKLELTAVSLGQIWIHFAHRIGAVIVIILLWSTAAMVLGQQTDIRLRRPAMMLIGLLIAQVLLGILTVLLEKPADIASFHVAVGALILMTAFVLLVRAMRLYSPYWRSSARGFDVPMNSNPAALHA